MSRDIDISVTFLPVLIVDQGTTDGFVYQHQLRFDPKRNLKQQVRLVNFQDLEELVLSKKDRSKGERPLILTPTERLDLRHLVAIADLCRIGTLRSSDASSRQDAYYQSVEAYVHEYTLDVNLDGDPYQVERDGEDGEDESYEPVDVVQEPAPYFAFSVWPYLEHCKFVLWQPAGQLTPVPAILAENTLVACAALIVERLGAPENLAICRRPGCRKQFVRKKINDYYCGPKHRQSHAKARQRERDKLKKGNKDVAKKTR